MANRVLVIEDELILAENLTAYLQTLHCDVQTAADGATAITHIEGFIPNLIILDFRLPDMEGFDVLDSVARAWSGTCVLMTAHPTGEVCDGAAQRGIQYILFKPFPLVTLGRLVGSLLAAEEQPSKPPGSFVERRAGNAVSFPLQLHDGCWLTANRRGGAPGDRGPDGNGSKAS